MEAIQWVERLGGLGLALLMLYGLYKIAVRMVDKMGVPIVERVSKAFDNMAEAMKGVMRAQETSRLEAVERHAETMERLENSAKETRHDIRGVLTGNIGLVERAIDEQAVTFRSALGRVEQTTDEVLAEVRRKG